MISSFIVVGIVCFILGYAVYKKTDIMGAFREGASENMKVAVGLLPTLAFLMLAIGMFRQSGALDALVRLFRPLANMVGIPAEILPLALLRPISGSGALSLLEDILTACGPDGAAGRMASVLMASTETTFYTVSVYFACTHSKKPRKALIAATAGDITAFILSALTVRLFFG